MNKASRQKISDAQKSNWNLRTSLTLDKYTIKAEEPTKDATAGAIENYKPLSITIQKNGGLIKRVILHDAINNKIELDFINNQNLSIQEI